MYHQHLSLTMVLNFVLFSSWCLIGAASESYITTVSTLSRHIHPSEVFTGDVTSTDISYTQEYLEYFGGETNTEAIEAVGSGTGGKEQPARRTLCGTVPAGQKSTAGGSGDTTVSGVTHVLVASLVSLNQTSWKPNGFQRVWFNETTVTEPRHDRQLHTTIPFISAIESEEDDPFRKELVSPDAYVESKGPLDRLNLFFRVLAFGINLLNAVILSQKSMRSPATPYLIALAVAEFAHVSLGFVVPLYDAIKPLPETSYFYLTYGICVLNYGLVVIGRYTYCLTTLVCLERFFALAFPLRASRSRLIKSPLLVIVMCLLVVSLAHLYLLFRFEIYLVRKLEDGEEIYALRLTRIYTANEATIEAWGHAVRAVFVYLTLLLSLMMNVFLVVVLQRHGRSRQDMTTSDGTDKRKRQEREITVTILVSSTVFTLLGIPVATNAMLTKIVPDDYGFFSPRCHTFLFVQDLGGVLFTMSFCTDFFAFFIFNSSFRATLRQVLTHAIPCATARCAQSGIKDTAKTEVSSMYTRNSDISSAETRM